MPSIPQLISLRQKYGGRNQVETKALEVINENFRQSAERIKNSMSSQGLNTDILAFFERQESATMVLLYIDITGFSKKCKEHTNSQLAAYLDDYYDIVIPIIYTHGGEIEKIMGDGIVAVFGQPFLADGKEELFSKADKCAKD